MQMQAARDQLQAALLEPVHQERYWADFRLFLQGSISKEEWDARARHMLGELNVHLHNDLVLAIWAAAAEADQAVHGPDLAYFPVAANQADPGPLKPPSLATASLDSAAAAAAAPAATAVAAGAGNPETSATVRPRPPKTRGKIFELLRLSRAPGLPTLEQIRAAVYLGAHEHGLQDASLDASLLIRAAMEKFVRNVYEDMLVHSSSFSQSGRVRHAFKRNLDEDFDVFEDDAALTPADLALAIKIRPALLPTNSITEFRERVLARCSDYDQGDENLT